MPKVIVTYDVQQEQEELEVSQETLDYILAVQADPRDWDSPYLKEEVAKSAIKEMKSQLELLHDGAEITLVSIIPVL